MPRWLLLTIGVLAALNAVACAVLMVLAVLDDDYGRALFNFACALVSGCSGSYLLVSAAEARR